MGIDVTAAVSFARFSAGAVFNMLADEKGYGRVHVGSRRRWVWTRWVEVV